MDKAKSARQLLEVWGFGCLSTQSARHSGFPFVSVAEHVTDESGRPVFLFSGLAVHTKNLAADARASFIVFAPDSEEDALGSARVTLMGEVTRVAQREVDTMQARYLARHPQAAQWVGFGDFAFYRMEVSDVYYVGGFGAMGWVSGQDYSRGPQV